jgi:DNA adenine methylase
MKPEEGIVVPFLKWPGGKRWFVNRHLDVLPRTYRRYIEPFLGSASVYFAIRPERAVLADVNAELVDTYRAIRWRPQQVGLALEAHARRHSDEYYYHVRSATPDSLIERAARTLYLNRTCFNGIYRVNLSGQFNVPRGSKNSVILDTDDFAGVSKVLRSAELRCCDFECVIDDAETGDLIFADPPYTVRHNTNGFIKYNEQLFSWDDQERLAASLSRAVERGVSVVATNANHASVRDLYAQHGFRQTHVSRFSSISAASATRRQYEELILRGGEYV